MNEAAYAGNIGIMELVKFNKTAPEALKLKVKKLIAKGDNTAAWKIVQDHVGVQLKGKQFHESKMQDFKEFSHDKLKESRYDQHGSASVSSTGDGASKGRASSMPKQRRGNWKDDVRARARQMDRERARKRGEGKQLELKLESFSDFIAMLEEEMGAGAVAGAANAVSHGGVDMNPDGKSKRDRRSKWDIDKMFRRANGKYKK